MPELDTTQSRRSVPALERGAAALDLVAAQAGPIGVSEIARQLGLAKSSTHGICETLCGLDLLRLVPGGYVPGPRSLRWSAVWLANSTLVTEFNRIVAAEPRLRAYTVTLSMLDADQVIYLACRESDKPLGFSFQIGMRLPAVFTATGKAMLSSLTAEGRRDWLPEKWPAPLTTASVADCAAFERQVPQWQRLGHALDKGEIRVGMVCIGKAILREAGQPAAGIALSMTSDEARPEVIAELAGVLDDIARRLRIGAFGG